MYPVAEKPGPAEAPARAVPEMRPAPAANAGASSPVTPRYVIARSRLGRLLYASAGIAFVIVGVVGMVLPVLPTTPFLLLAAACFLRSSEPLYRWLLGNRVFGEHLRRYRDGEGLPLALKVWTLAFLWLTLGSSAFLAVPGRLWWVRALLLVVGACVTIHILRIKTRRRS